MKIAIAELVFEAKTYQVEAVVTPLDPLRVGRES
jgi:hypothetical protein